MDEASRLALIGNIEAAFEKKRLDRRAIVARELERNHDCSDIARAFQGKSYLELDDRELWDHQDAAGCLSAEGFRAYAPAFMLYCLRNEDPDVMLNTVELMLCPADELRKAGPVFWERLEACSPAERQAVAAFLDWLGAASDEEEVVTRALVFSRAWREREGLRT